MKPMDTLTGPMFDALRRINEGHVTASDIGAHANVLNALCDHGFLLAERTPSRQTFYEPTPMGLGAIAALKAPIAPREYEGIVAKIQRVVAEFYGLPIIEMISSRRSRNVARPRQVAMYLARELTTFSLPEIGRRFGNRDHTTVLHAIRTVERFRKSDRNMEADVESLMGILSPPPEADVRVDRTPCFKCGVRADIGCIHTRVAA